MKNKKLYLGDSHKAKRKWIQKDKNAKSAKKAASQNFKNAKEFWDSEYRVGGENFTLSDAPSSDLVKFTRWLDRQYEGQNVINKNFYFVDAGCGNGRNAIFLAENFGAKGIGYDISSEAVKSAENKVKLLLRAGTSVNVEFIVQNLNQEIPAASYSVDLVIDAVASHVLKDNERQFFKQEVLRVLTTGSYYFLKSLLLDDDKHAKDMINKYGDGQSSYTHPTMGIYEYVPTESELVSFYEKDFHIDKIERSFAHKVRGRANKRRYIVMYLRKK